MSDTDRVYQPDRVIVGHCPHCGRVVVVHNDHEVWPYINCECGQAYSTTEIDNVHRVERLMYWERPSSVPAMIVPDRNTAILDRWHMSGPELALYDEAPPEVHQMLEHAYGAPETYYVDQWPPQNSASPLFRDMGPQRGWSIGTERWMVTAWHNDAGQWGVGGSDDEGNQYNTTDLAQMRDWLLSDPLGMP